MTPIKFQKSAFIISTALLLALFALQSPAWAQAKKTTPAPAAKPATPAAKPAAVAPKTGAAGGATAGHTGTTTTTAGHTGVTTAGHTGVTTANRTNTTTRTTTTTTTTRTTGVGGAHPNVAAGRPGGAARPEARPGAGRLPGHEVRTAHGGTIRRGPGGNVRDVHVAGRNMEIHHGLNGDRRVVVERRDHSRLVAERGGRGYLERPYRYGGRDYARRSYYYHGRMYERYYGGYAYRGVMVNYYTPAVYYRPAFYGWAYNPWVAPVPYAWGFAANPWYGYYGFYFNPYPVYPSASLWLTDYLISTSLAAAYQAQVDAAILAKSQGQPVGAAPLTPETKELISAEVQRQIALENSEAQSQTAQAAAAPDPASSSIQRLLTDNIQHVFVAGHDIDVVNAAGGECGVSQGDALQLVGPPPADSTTASLIVLSSKGGADCHKADTVTVQISDLQEMQNHMRELIDQGMGDLQSKQGKGGLPTIPASAAGAPVKASFVSAAPPPDTNVGTEINAQLADADKAEKEVVAQAPADATGQQVASAGGPEAPPVPAAPPAPVSLMGMSPEEVTASLGQPTRIMDLGIKKIFVYKDMKVTFKNNKVTDAQ